jgi:hypothetical protein
MMMYTYLPRLRESLAKTGDGTDQTCQEYDPTTIEELVQGIVEPEHMSV